MNRLAQDLWEFAETALAVTSVVFITWLVVFFVEHA